MTDEITITLTNYIITEILKQPNRVIQPDDALLTSGMIDSFHLVDLSMFIEDKFGIRIDDFELNASTFDTLKQLTTLIEARK